jgi:class 3 adenylate cyclase/tetratricopeptide (TPR) repeat protein
MADDIAKWLEDLGLGQYVQAFADNEIDLDVLPELAEEDLRELGLPMGPRKKVLRAIGGAQAKMQAPPSGGSAGTADVGRTPEAERRQLTVMFCDLAGSTALASRLDPEDMRDVIRAYQDACAGVIARYGGYLAKYMGDGVLAYFGWPRGEENDAERAISAGLGIVEAVGGLARPKNQSDPLAVRIGIATGPVVVGDIVGEGAAREAAVTGGTPNLAARLQETAESDSVVIDPTTRALVGELFSFRSLGARSLKGIDGAVEAWRVTGEEVVESRFEAVRGQSLLRLVGRQHELALMRDRWELAKNGEGQVLLLSGEAGIGKSRLTQALMEALGDTPHFSLRFQCSPYHTDSAFNPIIRQIERAARFEREDAAEVKLEKLETLIDRSGDFADHTLPILAHLLSLPYESKYGSLDLTPQQIKQRTIDVLAAQVFGLAMVRPVLFLLEDAHWIDPTSSELLEQVALRAGAVPILVVITHRPEWRASFANQANATSLQLNRLGRRQIIEFVTAVADRSVPESMIEQIIDRTDGIPLFVEEMTRSLIESGFDVVASADAIPDTLHASLMARLDRLPAPARELAQIASVIGREINISLLARTVGESDDEVLRTTESLFQSQLMQRGGFASDSNIIFRHALIRDAAYHSLLMSRRREIHGKVARILENQFPNVVERQPELIARHDAEAGNVESAILFWRRAGERASALVANAEAVGHFRNALAQLASLPADGERDRAELEILLTMGVPLIGATGYASGEVRDNYSKARELSVALDDREGLFAATRGLWNCVFDRAELTHALELARELVELAQRDKRPDKMALAQRALGSTYMSLGEIDQSKEAFDVGLAISEGSPLSFALREHGESPQIVALQYNGWSECLRGNVDRGVALAQRAVSLARELGHPITLVFSIHILGILNQLRREYRLCHDTQAEVSELSNEHGFVFWSAGGKTMYGCALAFLDRPEAGLEIARQGIQDWSATGAMLHVPTWSAFLADAALHVGDLHLAESTLSRAVGLAEQNRDQMVFAELLRLFGLLELRRGNTAEGIARLESAIATARKQNTLIFELRAATDLADVMKNQGRHREAAETLTPVFDKLCEGFETADAVNAKALLDQLR